MTISGVDVTVSAWVKGNNDQTPSNWAYILVQTNHEVEFGVYNNTGNLIMKDNTATGSPTASGVKNITDDKWHHVVGTIDSGAGTISTYIDGVLIKSIAYSGGSAKTGTYYIGGQGGSLGWKGSIDDVRIYGQALTTAQIQKLYAEQSPRYQLAKQ